MAVPKNALGLHAQGTKLYKDGVEFRNIGVNHFNLVLRELVTFGSMTNPGPAADFAAMKGYGIKVVRAAFGWYDYAAWRDNYLLNKAAWYAACDKVIQAAEAAGIGLIANLTWSVKGFAEMTHYTVGSTNGPRGLAYRHMPEYQLMEAYIAEFVGRYKNSPAIYAWAFGNEFSATSGNEYFRTWKMDGTDPVAGGSANLGLRPDGSAYQSSDKMLTSDYQRYCRRVNELFNRYDPHGRIVISGNAIGTSFAVTARTSNALTADAKPQWEGIASTEFEPWIAYRDREYPVVCQHVYPGAAKPGPAFFIDGKLTYEQYIAMSKAAADALNKPLVLEEFGSTRYGSIVDSDTTTLMQEQANFTAAISQIQASQIPLAIAWNWDGQLTGTPQEWQLWKLTDPSRVYQLNAIAVANAAIG